MQQWIALHHGGAALVMVLGRPVPRWCCLDTHSSCNAQRCCKINAILVRYDFILYFFLSQIIMQQTLLPCHIYLNIDIGNTLNVKLLHLAPSAGINNEMILWLALLYRHKAQPLSSVSPTPLQSVKWYFSCMDNYEKDMYGQSIYLPHDTLPSLVRQLADIFYKTISFS